MGNSNKTFSGLIDTAVSIITETLFPILFGLALLYFLWGVYRFIKSAGDEKGRADAKLTILWGIVGLAVMVSIWGLVSIVTGTFGAPLIMPQIKPGNININSFQ